MPIADLAIAIDPKSTFELYSHVRVAQSTPY